MLPQRAGKSVQWQAANELRQLVWQMRGLRGEPKCAWWVLWWDLGLGRGGALDVTAAQIAAAIGAADAASGRRALKALRAAGLVVVDARDEATGRYTVYMPDPRDVLRGRRQASDGQGELFEREVVGDQPHESSLATIAPVAGRVSEAEDPRPSAATVPDTPSHVPRGGSAHSDRGGCAGASAAAGAHPPADVQAHPPRYVETLSLGLPKDLYVDTLKVNLPLRVDPPLDNVAREKTTAADAPAHPPRLHRADPAAASIVGAAANAVAANAADPLEAKVERLMLQVPGLWRECAQWAVDEVAGLHEPCATAKGSFTPDDLAKIVGKTRGLHERGQLAKPAWVYFVGACRRRFHDLGLHWPRFESTPQPPQQRPR